MQGNAEEAWCATSAAPVRQATALIDVSIVIVNYNGLGTVLETIRSVHALRGVRPSVKVIDDGSSDGSPEAIAAAFPDVAVLREPRNTREVNRLRNIGLATAAQDRVFVIDNDVTFEPDCLSELLRVMASDESVAVCTPRLMYANEPSRVYMGGARIHYIAATIDPCRDKPYDGCTAPLPAVGGGIALFDRRKVARVGGFDESYALAWGDDGELHQRLRLAGYRSLLVPTAVCFHEHKRFGRSRHYRAVGQVRNRWRFILTHYSVQTLLLIAPALLLHELVQAAFFTALGIPRLYFSGTLEAVRDLPATLRRRRAVQALRVVADRDLLCAGPIYVRPEHGKGARLAALAVRTISAVLSVYWRMIRPLLRRSHGSAFAPAITPAER